MNIETYLKNHGRMDNRPQPQKVSLLPIQLSMPNTKKPFWDRRITGWGWLALVIGMILVHVLFVILFLQLLHFINE